MITLDNLRILSEAYIDENDMFPGCDLADMEYLGESILYPYSMEVNMINEGVLGNIKETIKRIIGAIVNLFRTLVTKIGGWISAFIKKIKGLINKEDEAEEDTDSSKPDKSDKQESEPKEKVDTKTAADVMGAFVDGKISAKDLGDAMAAAEDATDQQKAEAAAASEAINTVEDILAQVKENIKKADEQEKQLKDMGNTIEKIKKAAKAMKKPEPETIEDAKAVVQEAEKIVRTLKQRMKGARRSSPYKHYHEAGSPVRINIARFNPFSHFGNFDNALTNAICTISGESFSNVDYLQINSFAFENIIERVESDKNDDESDEKYEKRVDRSKGRAENYSNRAELSNIVKMTRDDVMERLYKNPRAMGTIGVKKTDSGEIVSQMIYTKSATFKNKTEAKKAVKTSVDECDKWAQTVQNNCNEAAGLYEKYKNKLEQFVARHPDVDGTGVLNVAKFQQLKASVFNNIFSIQVKTAREVVTRMTAQYLGKNPTDLKTDAERGVDRKGADKVASKIRARQAAGDIPSYDKK